LGDDHPRRARTALYATGGGVGSGYRDRADRAGAECPRRRRPRRTRSARKVEAGGLMLRFIAKRLVSMVFVLFAISVLSFLIFFATPGVDPAARIAGRNADQATLRAVRKDFGLDKPIFVRYAVMMKKLFISRDLTSYVNRGEKVIPQVTQAAPVTLSLVFGAAVIWVVFSIAMGLLAAVFRGRPIDTAVMVIGLIGIS